MQTATVGPAIPGLSLEPSFVVVDQNLKTVEDIVLKYRVLPNALQVDSMRVDVRNEVGDLLFSADIPVANEGAFTWPKGQDVRPNPQSIVFEVENSDGNRSLPVSSGSFVPTEVPVVEGIEPNIVNAGSTSIDVVILGQGFSTSSKIEILVDPLEPGFYFNSATNSYIVRSTGNEFFHGDRQERDVSEQFRGISCRHPRSFTQRS